MFHQYIGDGANVFIAIVAVVVGFVAALSFVDFRRTANNEEENSNEPH